MFVTTPWALQFFSVKHPNESILIVAATYMTAVHVLLVGNSSSTVVHYSSTVGLNGTTLLTNCRWSCLGVWSGLPSRVHQL
jgi:hypothetical protein